MNRKFWTKKGDINLDVAQGGLTQQKFTIQFGLFLLSEIKKHNPNANTEIFCDDGLGVSSATPIQIKKIYKKICDIYIYHELSITVDANKKVVQFLDAEFNLERDTYKPFIKPNDIPLYVHQHSDHPKAALKNIPAAINRRLSALSSDEEIFASVAPLYQEVLNKAG